jgi:hypothetical protein
MDISPHPASRVQRIVFKLAPPPLGVARIKQRVRFFSVFGQKDWRRAPT